MLDPATAEPRFIDALTNLAQGDGISSDRDVTGWMLKHGFAIKRNNLGDGASGAYVITGKGLAWLRALGSHC